ncbi:uncharacterized protein [Venturia canescens]|uniref:uncharacterized protein n=1 Tax=Venturia canescens TaxID=32260 RepID=UPI001C9C20DC|nr:uncharacterized protein LOC122412186 [Venturia canescens]
MSKILIVCCVALIVSANYAVTADNSETNTLEANKLGCVESLKAMYLALVKQAQNDVNDKQYKDQDNIRIDAEVLNDIKTKGFAVFKKIIAIVEGLKTMGTIEENSYLDDVPLFCDEAVTSQVFSITEELLRLSPSEDD